MSVKSSQIGDIDLPILLRPSELIAHGFSPHPSMFRATSPETDSSITASDEEGESISIGSSMIDGIQTKKTRESGG
jgi:hypothetical protein